MIIELTQRSIKSGIRNPVSIKNILYDATAIVGKFVLPERPGVDSGIGQVSLGNDTYQCRVRHLGSNHLIFLRGT